MNQSEKVLLNSRLINQVKEANNFDFIRFFLAYSVMFNHFSTLTETDPFWFVSGGFRVKGFFIISGFLVMFSFLRTPNTRIFSVNVFNVLCRLQLDYFIMCLNRIIPYFLILQGIPHLF